MFSTFYRVDVVFKKILLCMSSKLDEFDTFKHELCPKSERNYIHV